MFTTGDSTNVRCAQWHKATFLIVVYTPDDGKDPMLRFYRNVGAGGLHAEVFFIDDVKREVFPGNGTFELYLNYTPCHVNYNKTPCCDLLCELMTTEKREVKIYALSIYKKYEPGWKEKLKSLNKCGISIQSMSRTRRKHLLSFFQATFTEHMKEYDAIAEALSAQTTTFLNNAGIF